VSTFSYICVVHICHTVTFKVTLEVVKEMFLRVNILKWTSPQEAGPDTWL
jgi:hypothetical protein